MPATIRAGHAQVGRVTSATNDPKVGAIALGIVRRPRHIPGTRVSLHYYADGTQETETRATIADFPLKEETA